MKIVFLLLALSQYAFANDKEYSIKDYEKTPKTLSQVTRLAIKYQRSMLVDNLQNILFNGRPSRFVGSEGHSKVRTFIIDTINKSSPKNPAKLESFKVNTEEVQKSYRADLDKYLASGVSASSEQAIGMRLFTESMLSVLSQSKDFEGQNIVWEKKGFLQPEEVLIIGAHYDTIAQDPKTLTVSSSGAMPGADNNASGVAAALAVIEVASKVNIAKTIRVIFFDAEELGQSGSKAYIEAHSAELSNLKVAGFLNLLMLGHDTNHDDKLNKSGNMRAYTRTTSENEKGSVLDQRLVSQFTQTAKKIRSSVHFEPTQRSDLFSSQTAFQNAGFAGAVMTHDWENDFNTNHHTKQDFAETLNFATFHSATQAIIGAALAWSFDMR
ncbi:MAG: M20/M25/M40 family metallo-hydrolase [bacterium]